VLQELDPLQMDPKADTPRKRSGSLHRFEPTGISLIEQNPDHLDAFKRLGCLRFFQKLDGHHLEVSRDFVKNYREGKTQVGPMEINLTVDLIAEVTEIPMTGEQWFKARKLEKEGWCQDMLKPEHKGANLVKGIPRQWLLEAYDKLLLIIQRYFTCEGRYNKVLQYHFKLLLHFTGKKEIDLAYFLFMSLQRMILLAQKKPDKLEKAIFHHALIKLIVTEQLKKECKFWPTFLFVSNYQIDMPASFSKPKTPRKKTSMPSFDSPPEAPQSSQALVSQNPPPVRASKRNKGKGKGKEVVTEEEPEVPVELPPIETDKDVHSVQDKIVPPVLRRSSRRKLELIEDTQKQMVCEEQLDTPIEPSAMEVDDDLQIIEVKAVAPALRRSLRNKLAFAEQSQQEMELVKPRIKLPKLKVSPLEKEAQGKESSSEAKEHYPEQSPCHSDGRAS
jgi:hypothetical protein